MSEGNDNNTPVAAVGENRVAAHLQERMATLSALISRASIASAMGKSYGGDRDLVQALGYLVSPTIDDYMALYRRQDVAKPVIDKPAEVC